MSVQSRSERLRYCTYPTRVSAIIPDEVMRFCGENVLTFTSLEKLEKRTKDYEPPEIEADLQDAIDQALHDEDQEQNVVIDASRIPILKNSNRIIRTTRSSNTLGSRLQSASRLSSAHSKNVRARSALGRATAAASSGGGTLIYPKARGLNNNTNDNFIGYAAAFDESERRKSLDPSFGAVHNFYDSLDLNGFRARSDSPLSSAASVSDRYSSTPTHRGRSRIRPTRLPILMTRSASAASNPPLESNCCVRSASTICADMVMIGSQERLADNMEETPLNVSKRLLSRCINPKRPNCCKYSKRLLLFSP
ncbi:unnamed protein product [Anisakis simplex]|uniref:Expressed conserved protein n=1 Tax=Anisakis simplex TaxID=6269 RepID=A0A0M3KDR8_ANISI|nr:unnamed protein product [Anisakis simplex]